MVPGEEEHLDLFVRYGSNIDKRLRADFEAIRERSRKVPRIRIEYAAGNTVTAIDQLERRLQKLRDKGGSWCR